MNGRLRIPVLALWAAPVLVGGLLRLVNLGGRPLSPDEAQVALLGWRLWREGVPWLDLSPVLPNLHSLVFGLFGAGDMQARLPVALAGVATVAVPLLLRRQLGAHAALAACWLLAVSPLLVFGSRTVSSAPIGLLALALAVAAWLRWVGGGDARWLAAVGAVVALGLGSTYAFTVWLVVLVLAAGLAVGPAAALLAARASLQHWKPLAVGAAATIVALHLRLLTVPSGLQVGLVDAVWRWPVVFGGPAEPRNLALLVSAEAPLLALAMAGLWLHSRPLAEPLVRFLAVWLVAGVALAVLVPAASVGLLLWPLFPAALLGGRALAEGWAVVRSHFSPRLLLYAAAAWVPLVYFLLAALSAARFEDPFPLVEALIGLAGLALVALIATGPLGSRELRAGALLVAASIGLVLALSWNGRLNLRPDVVAPLPGEWSTQAVRELTAEAQLWARQRPGERLPITEEASGWLLWPLRTIPMATVPDGTPGALALATSDPGAVPGGWRMVRQGAPEPRVPAAAVHPVGVVVKWAEPAGLRDWWHWLVYGGNWVTIRPHAIIPARSDADTTIPTSQ